MNLYELTDNFKELESLVEDGVFTQEHVADTLEAIEASIDDKLKACMHVRSNAIGRQAAITSELDRLNDLLRSAETQQEGIEQYVKSNMLKLNRDKVDLGIFKLTLRKASKKLGELDEAKIPKEYWIKVPASVKMDKRKLLSDAKLKDIDGVTVVDSERGLTVK